MSRDREAARPGCARRGPAVLVTVLAVALAPGCKGKKPGPPPPGAPQPFDMMLDLPPPPGKPPIVPPGSALSASRVWVNQETPRQKKTPEWRLVPAKEGAALEMAADGKWRCVVDAVKVHGKSDEDASVAHWTTSRSVRCSADGFRTFVQGVVREGYDPAGKPAASDARAVLHLHDVVGGAPRTTVVALEGDGPGNTNKRRTF